jgi:hypothetical protein
MMPVFFALSSSDTTFAQNPVGFKQLIAKCRVQIEKCKIYDMDGFFQTALNRYVRCISLETWKKTW